jgi:hypothetical protein
MGEPHTQEHTEPEKHRVDVGRRRMIFLDGSDPDGAYAALMALVEASHARHENDHTGTLHSDQAEP